MNNTLKYKIIVLLLLVGFGQLAAQERPLNLNRPEREQWFAGLGFGMFIHWSLDVQLGMVISHSLVGASDDYVNRYFNELPTTFYPESFNPAVWAKAARMAGMKYVVFTTKHHNGFCMYDTKTTDFNIYEHTVRERYYQGGRGRLQERGTGHRALLFTGRLSFFV